MIINNLRENSEKIIAEDGLIYETVYKSENFLVREAYLGLENEHFFENFSMPSARITDPVEDLGIDKYWINGKDLLWETQLASTGWCTDTIKIISKSGIENTYEIVKDHLGLGGHYILKKNGEIIWEADLSATTQGPIISSKVIGEEIAIEYIIVKSERQSDGLLFQSILLTQGNGVIDILGTTEYDAIFAPNEIEGKLTYFAKDYGETKNNEIKTKIYLVYDSKKIVEYDHVFNQTCCWDGPPIQVIGNDKVVDYFAIKGNSWYHVQAGYFIE
jgi:hypothetical protein